MITKSVTDNNKLDGTININQISNPITDWFKEIKCFYNEVLCQEKHYMIQWNIKQAWFSAFLDALPYVGKFWRGKILANELIRLI